ncbi:MAG: hypothetical protein R2838_26700 [Caldilineaceae bacterium]
MKNGWLGADAAGHNLFCSMPTISSSICSPTRDGGHVLAPVGG